MPDNTERFTGRVREYVQYRERYDPAIVLPLLIEWCGLAPMWIVADVGAGTGMLADVFLTNGNPVIAVEPNVEMRDACRELHRQSSQLEIIDGTAETTGLGDGHVDMVSVGRALHWFDNQRAMQEFRRVLKPGGWVAVIAFGRSKVGREENLAYEEFLKPYTPQMQGTHAGYGVYQKLEAVFAGGTLHHREIAGEFALDWEQLRGLTLSLSHAPLPEDPHFQIFEQELEHFYHRYEIAGKLKMTSRYWISAGQFERAT